MKLNRTTIRNILPGILAFGALACSLWEYDDPSEQLVNQPPETYVSLIAQDTIYASVENVITYFDSAQGMEVSDTTWNYLIGNTPDDTSKTWDTLSMAFATITASRQHLSWWGEDLDGNVVAYDIRWSSDTNWARTTVEDSLFYVPIRTALDVFEFSVRAVDDSGLVDPMPSRLVFPIRNSRPEISFRYGSNPLKSEHGDTSFTFPTRTFVWDATDLDGSETITDILYALDDTCSTCWDTLDSREYTSVTLKDLEPGIHTMYLKARDIAGAESDIIRFPDPDNTAETRGWVVKPVLGDILLVDDFPQNSSNTTKNWYRSILDSIVGPGQYSTWEIGESLPYSKNDLKANLAYFDHVIWFSAYTGQETYLDASSNLYSYVLGGGNLFINTPDLKDSTFVFFPLKSTAKINPKGRLLSGRRLVSQIDGLADLVTSTLIAIRVKSFVPDETQFENVKNVYLLDDPVSGDEWTGNPIVCAMGQFQSTITQKSGKVVLMSLPLHSGSDAVMEGEGSALDFLDYIINQEFRQ